jgi:hypothetical protein
MSHTPLQMWVRPVTALLSILCAGALGCGGAQDASQSSLVPANPPSRCTTSITGTHACQYQSTTIAGRSVLYQTPLGTPPTDGWPVVINFQGSFFAPSMLWSCGPLDATNLFGGPNHVMLLQRLLDGGYAVITPAADLNATAWDTNVPPWSLFWPPAPDNGFLAALFAAIDAGQLGPLSKDRWYATGVSSGGYMTSRMAVSYQGRFRALAIESGSYATCSGPLCTVPDLPADHPPTLFLHGGADPVVPVTTMYTYRDKLTAMAIPTRTVVDPLFMHGWIPAAPDEVFGWFNTY